MAKNMALISRQLRDEAEVRAASRRIPESDLKDKRSLIHELQVHQVELELQNEELNRAVSRAESALKRYTALYDFAPVSYISLDVEAMVSHVNIAAARLLGVPAQRIIEGNLGFFIVAEDRSRFFRFLKGVLGKKNKSSCLVDMMSNDKGVRQTRLTATALPGDQASKTLILLHIDDLTETEKHKRKLKEALLTVDLSQRNASIGTWVVDFETERWSSSETFNELHAVDRTVERNLDAFLALMRASDRARIAAALHDAKVMRVPFEDSYHTLDNGIGGGRQMLVHGTVERGENGGSDRLVCTSQDVTDREKYKAEKEAAEKASREKDVILTNVSHELRTPLTSILLRASLLQRGAITDAKVKSYGGFIAKAAKQQSLLIEDLLDLSRISTGALHFENEYVNVQELVASVAETNRVVAEQKGIELLSTHENKGVYVLGDRSRLSQVLSNLIGNAIKFTPPKGKIDVKLQCAQGWVKVSVRDTGRGVDSSFLPRLFERFAQEKNSIKEIQTGLGIGLTIAHEIIDAHQGTIEVKSEGKGCGSVFTIKLPVIKE